MAAVGAGDPDIEISFWRATPFAIYPAGVVGGLVGFVAAWFLFGWISRRTGSSRTVAALFLAAMGHCDPRQADHPY